MLFLAWFVIAALVELFTFLWVEARIGLPWALGLALATAVIGSFLVRTAGVAVWGQIRAKLSGGLLPGRELTHAAAILVAGAFLISPGFITDTIGFLLLVPAVRDLIHGLVSRRFRARVRVIDARTPLAEPWPGDVIDIDEVE